VLSDLTKTQLHHVIGRIVDKHKQGASRTPILEPIMIRAINLDQLVETFPTHPWLMKPALLFAR